MATRGRPRKDASKSEVTRLQALVTRQDQAILQAHDQISDLQGQVEFYRKQVNHFLSLLNILAKGA
jgi:TolA-binding protein